MIKNISFKYAILIASALAAVGVVGRLLPHVWNTTPVAAVALFAGFLLGWRYALIVPVIVMLASDIFIGFDSIQMTAIIYGSFILMGFMGLVFRKRKKLEIFLAGSAVASTFFFLITNAAVWLWSGMYTLTFEGLMTSYAMGLPFYKNMLVGDLFYVTAFFGVYKAVEYFVRQKYFSTKIEFSQKNFSQNQF